MEVHLNESEQQIVQLITDGVIENNKRNNSRERKRSPRSGREIIRDGFGAELAFAKMATLYPGIGFHDKSCIGGADFVLPNGMLVDVKYHTYDGDDDFLLVPSWKENKPVQMDVYVLFVGEFPRYIYRGYILRDELFKKENLLNLGYGWNFAVKQKDLRTDLSELGIDVNNGASNGA